MNILNKGIYIRKTSSIILNQGYIRAFSLISKLCTIAAQNLFYGDGRDIRNHWSVE